VLEDITEVVTVVLEAVSELVAVLEDFTVVVAVVV
jgi:hypothetical protein